MPPVQRDEIAFDAAPGLEHAVASSEMSRRPFEGEDPPHAAGEDGLHVGPDSRLRARQLGLHALVSSARHELRSPLQSIQGFAELLAAESYGSLSKEQRVFVEHIIHSTGDLSRAVDACFDLAQIELLHPSVTLTKTTLGGALAGALAVAQSSCDRPIEARLDAIDPGLSVELDSTSFRKGIGAIVSAVAPQLRGSFVISASHHDDMVVLLFGPDGHAGVAPFWDLRELTRGSSCRALLWLRVAGALLEQNGAVLEACERFERARIVLRPLPST